MSSRAIARHVLANETQAHATPPAVEERDDTDDHEHVHVFEWREFARIAFVAMAKAAVWFGIWEPVQRISVIGVIGLLVADGRFLSKRLKT